MTDKIVEAVEELTADVARSTEVGRGFDHFNVEHVELLLSELARLRAEVEGLRNVMEPEALQAIADEIQCFEHSARAAGLRGIAKRQFATLQGEQP